MSGKTQLGSKAATEVMRIPANTPSIHTNPLLPAPPHSFMHAHNPHNALHTCTNPPNMHAHPLLIPTPHTHAHIPTMH